MASPKDLSAIGRAVTKGIGTTKRLKLGAGLTSRALTPTLGSMPAMSMQTEDALGIRPSNRRLIVRGGLGARTFTGMPAAPAMTGRGRRRF